MEAVLNTWWYHLLLLTTVQGADIGKDKISVLDKPTSGHWTAVESLLLSAGACLNVFVCACFGGGEGERPLWSVLPPAGLVNRKRGVNYGRPDRPPNLCVPPPPPLLTVEGGGRPRPNALLRDLSTLDRPTAKSPARKRAVTRNRRFSSGEDKWPR